ncbi:hypothetical protein KUV28_18170 [Ferrimonas balearica]|nr:hypothetical protein [Ferrimonas balearica]
MSRRRGLSRSFKPSFVHCLRRAVSETKDNPFWFQRAFRRLISYWGHAFTFSGLGLGVASLDDGLSSQLLNFFEEYVIAILALLALPYVLAFFSLGVAFFARLHESLSARRPLSFGGIPRGENAAKIVQKSGYDGLIVGDAIEIVAHPFLDERLDNNGWHPAQVELDLRRGRFQVPDEIFSSANVVGENGRKFSLLSTSRPVTDDFGSLRLSLQETDYATIEGTRRITDADVGLRHAYSALNPAAHKIPNSLCLHMACVLRDNNVLAMRRRMETSYFPGAISVSFEEQLASEDFHSGGASPVENWFRRGICEEVFPMANRHVSDPKEAWDAVRRYVNDYRVWSLIFEEAVGNFSLFGVVRLNLTTAQYISAYQNLRDTYGGKRDDEGRLAIATPSQLRDFLDSGHGNVRSLNLQGGSLPGPEDDVAIGSYHPTTPYRCALLLKALTGGSSN